MDLILHIGDRKTASTFIQKNLLNNYQALLASKVFYPLGKNNNNKYTYSGNAAFVKELNDKNKTNKIFLRLFQQAKNLGCNKIILSNEGILKKISGQKKFEILNNLKNLDYLNVKIIFFIRDPYEFFVSLYSQRLKHGYAKKFNEFLNEHKHLTFYKYKKYQLLIQKLKKLNIDYECINYSKNKKNIFETFAKKSNLESKKMKIRNEIINKSVAIKDLDKIIKYNTLDGNNKDKQANLRRYKIFSSSSPKIKLLPIKKFYIFFLIPLFYNIFVLNFYLDSFNKLRYNTKNFILSFLLK